MHHNGPKRFKTHLPTLAASAGPGARVTCRSGTKAGACVELAEAEAPGTCRTVNLRELYSWRHGVMCKCPCSIIRYCLKTSVSIIFNHQHLEFSRSDVIRPQYRACALAVSQNPASCHNLHLSVQIRPLHAVQILQLL